MDDLGAWLRQEGLISAPQLEQARRHVEEKGVSLAVAVVELGLVPEPRLVDVLATRHDLPKAPRKLHKISVPPKALAAIPQDHCWQFGIFPFGIDLSTRTLKVAVIDPADSEALELLAQLHGGLVPELYLAGPRELEKAIRKHYLDSIVDDTVSPKLRFFGYERTPETGSSPRRSRGGNDPLVAVPGPPAKSPALPPEPALASGEHQILEPLLDGEDAAETMPDTEGGLEFERARTPAGAERLEALEARVAALELALSEVIALLSETGRLLTGQTELVLERIRQAKRS